MDTARTALVTGANRGLGLATCALLRERGYRVILTARDGDLAAKAAAELGAEALALDVTDAASVTSAAAAAGPVDILVNNAGVLLTAGQQPGTADLAGVERELAVNALGAWRVSQAFLPGMLARGWGRVVMVSSGTGTFHNGLFGGTPGYSLSKLALNGITTMLAGATEGRGVLVNAVNPGLVRTRMRPEAQRPPEEAAEDVVAAATLPPDGPTGTLLRHGKSIPW
ncbi:SDR family NAD(P)-dependent oxidoreductase [Amycolatopsis sp. NPDC021455]|uniref:SDR family NAD(P)-dependent oxidoreductase n=1 Tax=Amycolatopsis sp. NPDC021455 TaxID=3154901 RepID=UPI0033D3094D